MSTDRRVSGPRPRAFRFAVGASVVVHGALVAAAVLVPAYAPAEIAAPMVMVDVVAEVMPPEPEVMPPQPEVPRAQPALARPIATRRAAPLQAAPAPTRLVVQPTPTEQPPSDTAPVVAATLEQTSGDGPSVLVATAPSGLTGAGTPGPGSGEPASRGHLAPMSEAQRSSMIGRYRDLLRNRIRDGFRYPAEARELELVGQVVVQVTVDRGGHLLAARLRGPCPHPLLCDDALRTIRSAAPFSPMPRDLGESLQIEVPLNYSFE